MDIIQALDGGFSFTTKTIKFMQDSIKKAIEFLTLFAGSSPVILEGVINTGGVVSSGVIIYQGEPIPFVGGSFNATVIIYENIENAAYNEDIDNDGNKDLKPAYIKRYAKCGVGGVASFPFADLKRIGDLVPATATEVADDNNTGKFFDIKTLLTRTPSETKRGLVRAANTTEIKQGVRDDLYLSVKQAKQLGIVPLYRGTQNIGDIDQTDFLETITFPSVGTSNYMVLYSVQSLGSNWNSDNDITSVVDQSSKTYTSFKIAFREFTNGVQNLRVDYVIYAL